MSERRKEKGVFCGPLTERELNLRDVRQFSVWMCGKYGGGVEFWW